MAGLVELEIHPDVWLDPDRLRAAIVKKAGRRRHDLVDHQIVRKAIDARKGRVRLRLRVQLWFRGDARPGQAEPTTLPTLTGEPRAIIVGAGPAGLFCAWRLATLGLRSIVLERGKPVRERRRDLAQLVRHGSLDPESNYCFGEGGAGTFSDGKLYTRADKRGEIEQVLRILVDHGASPDILVDARPHIGTNRLPGVISRLRAHLESAGVEVRFQHRVDRLRVEAGRIRGVVTARGQSIDAPAVVVASGHSAPDVVLWCRDAGAAVEFKAFAMGVRIEHSQLWINQTQFGELAGHPALGAASYRLVERIEPHAVFSFCMCPGGFMAPAATQPHAQVVNGWSPSSRGGHFANSGFVVEVGPALVRGWGGRDDDPLAGMEIQRRLEQAAYQAGGGSYVGPAQTLRDLVDGRMSDALPNCSYPRGVTPAPLHDLLGPLAGPLRSALRRIDQRMPGFVSDQAIAVGVESRTSAPVRLPRGPDLQSTTLPGLYPTGEGAGYAGGIMSAALDGMRVAEAIAQTADSPVPDDLGPGRPKGRR